MALKKKKIARRMSSEERREAIIAAVQRVFAEKGIDNTTTRELADAAGVSEALLFRHFPNKEAIYSAIQEHCSKEYSNEMSVFSGALQPSTDSLVAMIRDFIARILHDRADAPGKQFFRLVLRSILEKGEFARQTSEVPLRWIKKLQACIKAAQKTGDIEANHACPTRLAGLLVHLTISGLIMNQLPEEPVIPLGGSCKEQEKQIVKFCLRGIGMKDKAIKKYFS